MVQLTDSKRKMSKTARNSRGISLMELVIGTMLIGITLAALGEFMGGLLLASNKLNNQIEAQSSMRTAISRIRGDVRAARTIGDCYSIAPSNQFPGPGNWLYTTPPIAGWPADWGGTPYKLDGQTLIVQVPAFYNGPVTGLNGFSMKIDDSVPIAGVASHPDMEDLDTIVYKVVQDPSDKTVFSLQMAMFPGLNNQSKAINPPQTLVKGIIGPTTSQSNGMPEVFTYLTDSTVPTIVKNPTDPLTVTGVRIDMEVRRPIKATEGSMQFQKNVSAHAEAFPRWNRM